MKEQIDGAAHGTPPSGTGLMVVEELLHGLTLGTPASPHQLGHCVWVACFKHPSVKAAGKEPPRPKPLGQAVLLSTLLSSSG